MARRSGAEVQAAGAVLWRRTGDDIEVALVHRPKYDDWSLPKGKLDEGETHEEAALREVAEETGAHGRLGPELTATAYVDSKGRPKLVRYWAMELDHQQFTPNDEVDDVEWMSVREAEDRLSYAHDVDVLHSFVASQRNEQ